jgi:hypothetical protein
MILFLRRKQRVRTKRKKHHQYHRLKKEKREILRERQLAALNFL